jgi:hypothetical protein
METKVAKLDEEPDVSERTNGYDALLVGYKKLHDKVTGRDDDALELKRSIYKRMSDIFSNEMDEMMARLGSERRVNVEERRVNLEKKEKYNSVEIHTKIRDIDKIYGDGIKKIEVIMSDTKKVPDGDVDGIIVQQKNYMADKFTKPHVLIEELNKLERDTKISALV